VLEALLRARPAFLSAEDLLEQVWEEHAESQAEPAGLSSNLRHIVASHPSHCSLS
jgi:DNA-binding winged helix-turn-helix (wHTH) protein